MFILKKLPSFLASELFKYELLGEELRGNNCIFQDSIGLCELKTFPLKKWPLFALELFKYDYLEMSYVATTAFFKIA